MFYYLTLNIMFYKINKKIYNLIFFKYTSYNLIKFIYIYIYIYIYIL